MSIANFVWAAVSVALSLTVLTRGVVGIAGAEGCGTDPGTIQTDRPDVTNSSIVVPNGTLQVENGINLTGRRAARIVDGTNSRIRLGVADCVELLVDLPNYLHSLGGEGPTGFSDTAPAVKIQLPPLPGDIVLSATAGLGLPTGASRISGNGVNPYLQFPWSREIAGGWGLSGMLTQFWFSGQSNSDVLREATLVVQREIGPTADLFIEYVGDYPNHGGPTQSINSGGAYRFGGAQQIDFHLSFGLNKSAPAYIFGVGYSVRFDRIF